MFKWLEKLFQFPTAEKMRSLTFSDAEETENIIRRAHDAEIRFDGEFNSLMQQLDAARRRRDRIHE